MKFLRLISTVFLALSFTAVALAVERPRLDRSELMQASSASQAALDRARSDPALLEVGRIAHVEPRYALPTFLWAATGTRGPMARQGTVPATTTAAAARAHLDRVARFYRLDPTDVRDVTLHHVHDTGRGGVIASFGQVIDGVEVFRDEMNVMMNRAHELVAVSGFLPSRSLLGRGEARAFRLSAAEATARALEDFTGLGVGAGHVRAIPGTHGGYQTFDLAAPLPGFLPSQPLRAKPVWFHLPESLVPAYYVEVLGQDAYAYVIAARSGEVFFRNNLVVSDQFGYRVWADSDSPFVPWDGPQGTTPSPHPTGTPNLYDPPLLRGYLVSVQEIPGEDPWLPPGATETVGNNVDAYCDVNSPDGLTAGDFRASTSAPFFFDYTYNHTQEPGGDTQRRASITQLFFTNNFLHDWFYDSGFDEASGNAQASNYGRGGVEGDRIRAEAQDYGGTNNANMTTPADGGQPRMQMYIWNRPAGTLNVSSPPPIAGNYHAGIATFGPQTFTLFGTLVAAYDGIAPHGDACSGLINSVFGKIVLIDRGSCGFVTPVLNAQAAGAIGAIIVDNLGVGDPPLMNEPNAGVEMPVLSVTTATGNLLKAHLGGTVNVSMNRATAIWRDGTIDNQITAHEWAHYLSNRLVGNGGGLSNHQSNGMGEGWSDFVALLLTARAGDDFNGVYPMASYAYSNSVAPTNAYYFGFRRYPYSTDMTKDPLTFRHIQNGVPLPVGPPVRFGADGSDNAEVHHTGEVWCSMLWECYAALLNDSGRLTFTEAQRRMRDYLVASLKMTPNGPTFTEARDALLATVASYDPVDFSAFWAAFAKRGAGVGAVSPDRYALDNVGVTESYAVGGDLAVTEVTLTPAAFCDGDGYLDNGEEAHLAFTIRNVGATHLDGTEARVTSSHPAVSFPNGNVLPLPPMPPFASASATLPVRLTGAETGAVIDLQVAADDPGLLDPGPRLGSVHVYGHVDEDPVADLESFETVTDVWTYTGDSGPSVGWMRKFYGPLDRRLYAFDPGTTSDASAMTPPLTIGTGAFRLAFEHAYRLEETYDGGVIEISTDGGANWTDIGGMITVGGYTGTIVPGSALSGRQAWTGTSPGYPALTLVMVELGTTYANQTVRVRLRAATDGGVGDAGWSIANFDNDGNQAPVFRRLIGESNPCGPLAVENGERVTELAFTMAGANPVKGPARFRFALPAESRVDVAIYDVTGRRVALLADGTYEAGVHVVAWDAAASGARRGLYFARMTAGDRRLHRRVVVVN